MAKPTRPLTGFAKDAWLKRQIAAGGSIAEITRRLQAEIASLKVRATHTAARVAIDTRSALDIGADAGSDAQAFDPFTPNVVVVVRTRGAETARAALSAIPSVDDLRLLAREQRLAVEEGIADQPGLVAAIVAAAERRIANRRAAAS